MTTILTHLDSDGICSAALIKMTERYSNVKVFFTHPAGLAQDLQNFDDDLLICDIAVDHKSYQKIYSRLEKISQTHSIFYFDHHSLPGPLPPKVINIHNEQISATEIIFRYFYHELPKYSGHIALIGAICDYLDDSPLMRELLHHYERRTIFLDVGLLAQGLKNYGHGPEYNRLRDLVDQLSKGKFPCEIKELTDAALMITRKDKVKRKKILDIYKTSKNIAYIIDPPFGSRSKIAHWIMGHSGSLLGLTIRHLKSKPHLVDITIRGRNLIDLRTIIPPLVDELGGNAGGHANAIGCRLPREKLNQFLKILDDTLSSKNLPQPFTIEELIEFD